MFCPQCSQQQLSDEMRFCSRCGFPLDGVARLLESGGQLEAESSEGRGLTKRQREMRESFVAMFAGIAFAALAFLLTTMKEDLWVLIPVASLVFLGGLIRLAYVMLLEVDEPRGEGENRAARPRGKAPAALKGAHTRGKGLPPPRGFPAADFVRARPDTSEMAPPPSATENTTKLLEDEEGK